MTSVQASHREDRFAENILGALKSKNYEAETPTTHTLRELLMLSSVDMETSNNTNITALCTIETDPAETLHSFERLLSFTKEKGHAHKAEVSQVLFPVFVHFYLNLLSASHTDTALTLFSRYKDSLGSGHGSELKELSELKSADHLLTSSLVTKFRKQKFTLRMSSIAFHLLIQFLQVCNTPLLYNLIQRHITIEVYSNTPLTVDSKQELKKSSVTPSFTKPHLQLLRSRSQQRRQSSTSSGHHFFLAAGAKDSRPHPPQKPQSVSIPSTAVPPAQLSEFKEKLNAAAATSQLTPTPPSISIHTVTSEHPHPHCAAFNSKKSLFCFGFSDASLHLWAESPLVVDHMSSHDPRATVDQLQATNRDQNVPLLGHRGAVYSTCFNSRGDYMLSSSEDCTVRLWDVEKRLCVVCYHGHQYPVWNVSFSPVDVYFASCSHDTTARLWTCDLAFPLRVFAGHTAGVNVAQFHPNGKYIATGSSDHTSRLWDIHSGQCVRLFAGKKGSVGSIVFLPNGKHILTNSEDGTIHVWDLGSGAVVREFKGHRGAVCAMCCSSDGSLLATAASDHTLRIWNLNTNSSTETEPLSLIPIPDSSVLSLQFTHRNSLKALASHIITKK